MPEQVSSYRLEGEIARGGMGVVYRAVHTVFDEVVAIKAIFPELTLNPELRERFLNEAKIQRRLQHPNIVQIREFLTHDGKFYIVMEFIEGQTLAHYLSRLGRPMQADEAVAIFHQALGGLGFAHQQGVIHRDIKPSNIMLTRDGVAKLTDFGIARALGSAKLTRTGTAVGTPPYMSPEQIQGAKLDARADIYSMGITLYEMVTGRVPFERPQDADSDFAVLAAHINQPPPPPSRWAPGLPPFLETAILKALEKRPEKRFASCQEFQAAIAPAGVRAAKTALIVPPGGEKAPSPAPSPRRLAAMPELRPPAKAVPGQPPWRAAQKAPAPMDPTNRILTLVAVGLILIVLTLGLVHRRQTHMPEPESTALAPETSAPAQPAASVAAPDAGASPAGSANPSSAPAQIVVQTLPFAQVYLDDRFRGEASSLGRLIIEESNAGDHLLRVTLAGKRDVEQRIGVAAGQAATFEVPLADADQPALAPVETPHRTAPAARPGSARENANDGLRYVWIPPGTFAMGCSAADNECFEPERPAHPVTLTRGFWIGQTPATVGAYKRFAGRTRRALPPSPRFNAGWADDNMPIVNVTWNEAAAYCGWIGGRLPTEAEWEYAARGGSNEARYGTVDEVAWYNQNSGGQTHDVAQKRPNAFGLYDTLGNVWEWTNDWYDDHYYQNSPSQDPPGAAGGQFRALRAGSYAYAARFVRVSYRFRVYPYVRITYLGFRCAADMGTP
jgi:serine/threonine-protein kinase